MAAPCDENRLIISFVPSLLHCASVKIAVTLFQEFGVRLLDRAFTEIQTGKVTTSEEGREKIRRTKESLLDIPAHLRQGVMEAVHGSYEAITYWKGYYACLFELWDVEGSFRFRSDGTLDAVKSAQNLVRNPKFQIKKRFEVACLFCLVDSVETLWSEMVASGEAESFGTRTEDIVSFWVSWLNERPRVISAQSCIQSLGTLIPRSQMFDNPQALLPRFSAILPLLRPEERQECLDLLNQASSDDLRLSLYALTKEEEEQVLRNGVFELLCTYLLWPLQTLFLETAEKLWGYMDDDCFFELLLKVLYLNDYVKDFNYSKLFERFWNMSPPHFRENVEKWPYLKRRVDLYFEKKKEKICLK